MKYIFPIFIFQLLFSCDNNKHKNLELVSKIETIGINKFKNITYGSRNEVEHFGFHKSNDQSFYWTFNKKTNVYEFDSLTIFELKKLKIHPELFAKDLRTEIQNLKIISISQSPWVGNIIRFWINNEELISYLNPKFQFDDDTKKRWQNELKNGEKLKPNWYYIKM